VFLVIFYYVLVPDETIEMSTSVTTGKVDVGISGSPKVAATWGTIVTSLAILVWIKMKW